MSVYIYKDEKVEVESLLHCGGSSDNFYTSVRILWLIIVVPILGSGTNCLLTFISNSSFISSIQSSEELSWKPWVINFVSFWALKPEFWRASCTWELLASAEMTATGPVWSRTYSKNVVCRSLGFMGCLPATSWKQPRSPKHVSRFHIPAAQPRSHGTMYSKKTLIPRPYIPSSRNVSFTSVSVHCH